mgnify:CR=1 FL=1
MAIKINPAMKGGTQVDVTADKLTAPSILAALPANYPARAQS